MATYTLEGRYLFGKWTWVALKHVDGGKCETIGAYTDVAQAQTVVVDRTEVEQRGEE